MSIDIDRMAALARHGAAAASDAVLALIARLREAEAREQALEFQSRNREGLVQRAINMEEQHGALAAHYHVIRRELSACQSILHQLARAGEVAPAYAEDAKMALAEEPATSLASRDAKKQEEILIEFVTWCDSLDAVEDMEAFMLSRQAQQADTAEEESEMVACACGDQYPPDSYGAGFMAANGGVCENCAVAESDD